MATIYANYEVCSTWDLDEILDELGITREQVKSYFVKWDSLHLTYIDNTGNEVEEEFEPNQWSASEGFDWKRPTSVVEEPECNPRDFPGMTAEELKLYEVQE